MNNKIVVYTCIIGNYDNLKEIINPEKNIDYICFTDSNIIKSKTWEIRAIKNLYNLDNRRLSRFPKIMPHLFLKEYDKSVYVDGSLCITSNISKFIESLLEENIFCVPKHPHRNCIYQEFDAVLNLGMEHADILNKHRYKYTENGFPSNFGLTQNGLLIRKHNDRKCIEIAEEWWDEILNFSQRDQLSFMYIVWKNKQFKFKMLYSNIIYDGEYFKLNKHNNK